MELPRSTGSTASTMPWVNGSAKQTPPSAHAPIATVTYGFSSSPPGKLLGSNHCRQW